MALAPTSLEVLNSKDRYQRVEAILSLSASGDQAALPQLQPLLNDPDGLVAATAFYACWMLNGKLPALEPALVALASDDEEQVQTAVQILAQIGTALLPELESHLSRQSRYTPQILQLLGDIGGPHALSLVRTASQSGDADTAESAQRVIDEWED